MAYQTLNQRFGIDYFGTLDKEAFLLRKFLAKLMASGIEVFIISGASEVQLSATLPANSFFKGTHYFEAISIETFLKKKGHRVTYKMDGTYFTQEDAFYKSKSLICTERRISLMVDNEHRFRKYFTKECGTRFVYSNYAFSSFVRDYLEEPKEEEEKVIYPTNVILPC
jgi:hypothetical protein